MIGPNKFPRYLEQQQLAQGRRLDTLASSVVNGMAARSVNFLESIVVVGNSQLARHFDCRTQDVTNSTIGAAGFNAAAVTYSSGFFKYMACGSTEAVYDSTSGIGWTIVAGASSSAHPLFDIDSATGLQYVLAVGGNTAGDAIYQFRNASALTMSVAPDLFTRVKWHPTAQRFIVAGTTTIRAFDPTSSTTTLIDTHPEGTGCTVFDMFYDPITDSVHVLLRLPSGALRCTLVRGAAMTVTRSTATSSTFTTGTAMRGVWTRFNGPMYLFSGDGTNPRATAGMLASAAGPSTPELNRAYDPLVAPISYPGLIADSLLRGIIRVNNLIFAIAQGPSTEHRLYQMSDLLAAEVP